MKNPFSKVFNCNCVMFGENARIMNAKRVRRTGIGAVLLGAAVFVLGECLTETAGFGILLTNDKDADDAVAMAKNLDQDGTTFRF